MLPSLSHTWLLRYEMPLPRHLETDVIHQLLGLDWLNGFLWLVALPFALAFTP
jgi:hypothetical protein